MLKGKRYRELLEPMEQELVGMARWAAVSLYMSYIAVVAFLKPVVIMEDAH